ncbi:MAG TPA: response regulator [Capsulimonadaceae bacterium]|nr:response regulator [Capsulimonadaceae bacterium]
MSYRILVVDDEPTLVRLMEFILAKQGHTMLVANNGEEALEKARGEKPDLILLDIMMPRIDGYDVARTIRADAEIKETPIIMLSAKAQDEDIEKGMEVGVNEYITKPFAPDHLVQVVNDYLSRVNRLAA